jgi:lipopolysaccharide export system permease protein
MFMLIMQFFWVYIDDLMGKGLSILVILELLFYVSASLIPLALPLAILLSSIMTFGNLAENNELTALKASGLSLYKIIRPLTVLIIGIAIATFYFANYVIPIANFKWHSLIYDIQNTKIATIITPGVYSKELDGFAIKVDKAKGNDLEGILIHDHTSPTLMRTIRAETGKIYRSENGKYVYFELKDGSISEELAPRTPTFNPDGTLHRGSTYPARRSSFKSATHKINLTGFDLNRSQEDLFKDKHEMLNVFQIDFAIDSISKNTEEIRRTFVNSVMQSHPYFQATSFKMEKKKLSEKSENTDLIPDTLIQLKKLSKNEMTAAIIGAQSMLRIKEKSLQGQSDYMRTIHRDINGYLIEFNRKFALTAAIIILFFVGAPLGAIVRKGGFGAPVVIAALLFMIYFVLISIGDSLAESGIVSPFIGMWFASFVLTPFAIWFTISAANDRPLSHFIRFRKKAKLSSVE